MTSYLKENHLTVHTKLSLDSLTAKAGNFKSKLCQRYSYICDGTTTQLTEPSCFEPTLSVYDVNNKNEIEDGRKTLAVVDEQTHPPVTVADPINVENKNNTAIFRLNHKGTAPVIYGYLFSKRKSILLKRTLSLIGGVSMICGTVIGSGIFISPSSLLIQAGSVGLSLVSWLLCGVISLLAILCYTELGTSMPKSGSEYAYLLEGLGPVPAFLYSWTSALVIRPSAAAAISLVFAEYITKGISGNAVEDVPILKRKYLAGGCISKCLHWRR